MIHLSFEGRYILNIKIFIFFFIGLLFAITPLQLAFADVSTNTEAETEETETSSDAAQTFKALGNILGRVFFPEMNSFEDEEELSPLLGLPAPAIHLKTTGGEDWQLKDHQGKVVILDFWATWCGPCVAAMPHLQKLHEKLGDELVVIGVNQGESAEKVQEFLKEKGISFTLILDAEENIGSSYAVSGIPQTVLIDSKGIVQAVHVGFSPNLTATLESQIERLSKGEDLFDKDEVAKAREKRLKEIKKIHEQLGEVHPEKLEIVNDIQTEGKSIVSSSTPNNWFTMPTTNERSLVVDAGENQLLIIQPNTKKTELISLAWEEEALTWEFCATQSEGQLQWAATSYEYDDDYELSVQVALFDKDGKSLWIHDFPTPGEYPSLSLEAGDFNSDGLAEVVIVADYSDIDFGPEYSDVSRAVFVWDNDGTLIARKWLRGSGGTAVYVLPSEEGDSFLIQGNESLQSMRLTDGQ